MTPRYRRSGWAQPNFYRTAVVALIGFILAMVALSIFLTMRVVAS